MIKCLNIGRRKNVERVRDLLDTNAVRIWLRSGTDFREGSSSLISCKSSILISSIILTLSRLSQKPNQFSKLLKQQGVAVVLKVEKVLSVQVVV
jgi:hypothetical protein